LVSRCFDEIANTPQNKKPQKFSAAFYFGREAIATIPLSPMETTKLKRIMRAPQYHISNRLTAALINIGHMTGSSDSVALSNLSSSFTNPVVMATFEAGFRPYGITSIGLVVNVIAVVP
jgi:hypothetical protein